LSFHRIKISLQANRKLNYKKIWFCKYYVFKAGVAQHRYFNIFSFDLSFLEFSVSVDHKVEFYLVLCVCIFFLSILLCFTSFPSRSVIINVASHRMSEQFLTNKQACNCSAFWIQQLSILKTVGNLSHNLMQYKNTWSYIRKRLDFERFNFSRIRKYYFLNSNKQFLS